MAFSNTQILSFFFLFLFFVLKTEQSNCLVDKDKKAVLLYPIMGHPTFSKKALGISSPKLSHLQLR